MIESSCRNSAVPLLDTKGLNARIEPGAIIREQVEIGEGAVMKPHAALLSNLASAMGYMLAIAASALWMSLVSAACFLKAVNG